MKFWAAFHDREGKSLTFLRLLVNLEVEAVGEEHLEHVLLFLPCLIIAKFG